MERTKEAVSDIRSCITSIGGFARRLTGKKLKKSQYLNYAQKIIKSVKESEAILRQLEKDRAIFLGMRPATIDYRWRLYLPCDIAKKFNRRLLLKEGKSCLEIHRPSSLIFKEDAPYSSIEEIKTQKIKSDDGGETKKVVMIPRFLKGSPSFYCGKKVILVGRGEYLEIWPHNDE